MLPDFSERGIQVTFFGLILSKLVNFGLKLIYFGQIVVFANGLSLKLMTPHLKVGYYLFKPFSLFLLFAELTVNLFYLIKHLIKAIFHLFLPLVPLPQLFLNIMVFQLQLLDLKHLLLYL